MNWTPTAIAHEILERHMGHPVASRLRSLVLAGAVVFVLSACASDQQHETESPEMTEAPMDLDARVVAETRTWHAGRIERLTAPYGWLSLIDLIWLEEGGATLGSGPDSAMRCMALPAALVGTFTLREGQVFFERAPGARVTSGDAPVDRVVLVPDSAGDPTVLAVGTCTIVLIERGGRFGLRIRDRTSPTRTDFKGIDTYAADASWRIPARFEPFEFGHTLALPTVLGTVEATGSPGRLHFTVNGVPCTLSAIGETGDASWFCVFGDATNGTETYGGGRFLEIAAPGQDGMTVIDFNRSYNPPCAFTRYATCPLPPEGNRLPVVITAGERRFEGDH